MMVMAFSACCYGFYTSKKDNLFIVWFILCKLLVLAGVTSIFGAGLFLLVQVIILLDFTHSWNDSWVEKDDQKWSVKVFTCSPKRYHFCSKYCLLLTNKLIWIGILLFLWYQLDATLQHSRSQDFCLFGSILQAMTVASMSSS